MKLKEIIDFIDSKVPHEFALENDKIGFSRDYDLNQDINSVRIFMDLYPEDDNFGSDTLIVTHHPPLFEPESPTYTVHSNWDIIDGGANEALADALGLNVRGVFDSKTNIGRICECEFTFKELKDKILNNFNNARVVSPFEDDEIIKHIGIISGFGLKNPNYIRLASELNLDILISGDLTQETSVLAKNLNLCLIDLGHHESEVPGLFKLAGVFSEIIVDCEVIDKKPILKL